MNEVNGRDDKLSLLTYLRLAKKQLELLINFNEILLKDGISRVINSPEKSYL